MERMTPLLMYKKILLVTGSLPYLYQAQVS